MKICSLPSIDYEIKVPKGEGCGPGDIGLPGHLGKILIGTTAPYGDKNKYIIAELEQGGSAYKLLSESTKEEINIYFLNNLKDILRYHSNQNEELSKDLNTLINSIIEFLMQDKSVVKQ